MLYVLRLDRLPDPAHWLAMTTAELYAVYVELRDQGKLPPSNIVDVPLKQPPALRMIGHRETIGSITAALPDFVWPKPGDGKPRYLAEAFIGVHNRGEV